MRLDDLFAGKKPVLSLEIFPPKPDYPLDSVFTTLDGLHHLAPDFISVTYGAGGSTTGRSIEIAQRVRSQYGITAVAHLTCVHASRGEITAILARLHSGGVENILALRGDPPANGRPFIPPADGYRHASELIAHIHALGGFCVAAAAYPEGHPESSDWEQELYYLEQKIARGVSLLITQLFFDNALFYRFLAAVRARGITVPVTAGIMPVFNAAQIKRITTLCGATIPPALARLLVRYGDDPAALSEAGIEYACAQINDLLAHGVDGIHLYTMNKVGPISRIVQDTGLRPGVDLQRQTGRTVGVLS